MPLNNSNRIVLFPRYLTQTGYWLFICLIISSACLKKPENPYESWSVYKGDHASSSYSSLNQINRENVDRLEVAWIYNSGDHDEIDWIFSGSQSNPIIIDEILYVTTPTLKVTALNAASGELIWIFDPFGGQRSGGVNRGVVYWEEGNDKRIFTSAGSFLYAIHAETGIPVSEFGTAGAVDMREGLGRDPGLISVSYTSPGIIHKDLLIMGSTVGEGRNAAPGHIRAYNTRTGEIEWIFHTIPHPGEFGYETWGENAWQLAGGANNWAGMSLDTEREMVIIPTGSPAPDFYTPGTRGSGEHLFGNTVLALDANTGNRIWHYQIIPHDLWDYDLPAPANLVTIEIDGKKIDAVAQVTKQGFVFVLDRETGEPLFPVEERPVPQTNIEGEKSWPVQRFPVKPEPFVRQQITADDLTDISPEANAYARRRFSELNYEGLFTPVGEQETLFYPGSRGGALWGGASYDPETGMLYINANEFGSLFSLRKVPVPFVDPEDITARGESIYLSNCASCHSTPGGRQPTQFPSLENADKHFTNSQIMEVLNTGQGAMPPFPYLSDDEKEAIVAYLFNVDAVRNLNASESQLDENFTYRHEVDQAYQLFVDQDGYFATSPPWGTLNAINLNTGELAWKVPLGEYPELTEKGIPSTGTQNLGGSIVTAGGLVFIAATADEKFRAFDKETGEILWEYQLPAGGHASPSTYEIDGRQYIVIAAAGGTRAGTTKGDAFVAFALPDNWNQ